jgi:hypothetical protein
MARLVSRFYAMRGLLYDDSAQHSGFAVPWNQAGELEQLL